MNGKRHIQRRFTKVVMSQEFMTREQKAQLIDLTYRYAVLVGLIEPAGIVSDELAKTDRERWGHLIKNVGHLVFDETDAIHFMQAESGQPRETCHRVLLEEWPDPPFCETCGQRRCICNRFKEAQKFVF
jgi:hypothetical protein